MSHSRRSSRGRGWGDGKSTKTAPKKKTIDDYQFYIGTSWQATNYIETAEFIINHIKMSSNCGNDTAKTLTTPIKTETDNWMPTLKLLSEEKGEKLKERQNCQFELQYQTELDKAMKKGCTYNNNSYKAYPFYGESVQSPYKIKFKQERTTYH
eukprot:10844040-Ditylum_brightwellii.AAC.1